MAGTGQGAAAARGSERRLAGFRADPRLLMLAAMALLIGTGGAAAAWVFVKLIALVTNVVWSGALDAVPRPMGLAHRGVWTVAAPVLGGLAVGLMARFGSEKIRGHGFPEAVEAILIGCSRMSRGQHITREYGVDPCELTRVGEIMTRDVGSLPATLPLPRAIAAIAAGRHRA